MALKTESSALKSSPWRSTNDKMSQMTEWKVRSRRCCQGLGNDPLSIFSNLVLSAPTQSFLNISNNSPYSCKRIKYKWCMVYSSVLLLFTTTKRNLQLTLVIFLNQNEIKHHDITRPSPRRPHYAFYPVRLSVLRSPLTRKRSNLEEK